jgi:gliding motility-associated-like protein
MKYRFLFLFFITSIVTYSQYTLIPDPVFESFLIRNGYDSGNMDGKVLTANINTITKLDFYDGTQNLIASLKGIEDFVALSELNFNNGSLLSSLDISKNLALTKLICTSNNLTTLDVSKNINLRELQCHSNSISELDVSKNINLTLLNCSSNKLLSLNISKNIDLNILNCSDNKLTTLDTSSNLALTEIGCSMNQLTNLDVSKNSKLIFLFCNNNQISNLDLTKNMGLENLSCTGNFLTEIDFTYNTELTTLYCSNNKLQTLDFSNCSKLYTVDCHNNQLADINVSKNPVLNFLRCEYNQLTNLDVLNNLKLNYLTCHFNKITSLDVSRNNNLGMLRCNNNQLTLLDLRNSTSWTWWDDYNSWLNNPDLKCINVPRASFFNIYFSNRKDDTAFYFDGTAAKFESSIQTICSKVNPTIIDIVIDGYNIKWFDAQINGNELPISTLLVEGATYYAMNTAGTCEGPRSSVKITLKILAAPIAATPQTLCNIQNPTLDNLNVIGDNIKWYQNMSDVNSIPNTTPMVSETPYYASQTKNGCESSKTPVVIIIRNSSKPTATSPQTFCIQQNATINDILISGQNIIWYDALTNGNVLPNTTALQNGTTYYASQTINGCESERIPVLINIVNTAAPTGNSPQTFCSSQNPTVASIIASGTAIRWYDNTINGNLLPSTTPLQNGVTYYASQTENSCESPNRLALKIELINTLPSSNYAVMLCDELNDGKETVDLTSYNSNLISSTAGYSFDYYNSLSGAENESTTNQITNASSLKINSGVNIIYVRINSNTPCYAIAVLKLSVVAKPIIPIADIVPICENNTITISAGATTDSFSWSTGATTPSITITNPGEYAVTVTKNYSAISCSSSKSFTVKKSTIATITSIETMDWTDKNNMISVYVSGAGDFEYSIDGTRYQDSNEFQNLISGAYTVYVRDKNGCGIVTDKVYLLMYPKFFTPNGDGYNDTWSIHFSDTEIGLTVQLFDRYGKLITVLNQNQTWDGTFNGLELPSTDYWFIVTRADGKEYKGHFTLKR